MHWNRSATDIAAAWQTEIERELEGGGTALLMAGAPNTLLASASTLLAAQQATLLREDIGTPLLVAGGNSALWLGLLFSPHLAGNVPNAPMPTLIYGGADEATYLSLVTLTALQMAQPAASPAFKRTLSFEMGAHFAPRLQPGVATAWEMLPLVEIGEQPPAALNPVGAHAALAQRSPDSTGDWVVWGVMLLAFCLILSALLI
jgi:hypothetical protein